MSWDRTETHSLAEEAARWLIELEEPRPEVLRSFAAWLETSPRHAEEFLLATAAWRQFDDFDPERRVDIERLVAEARGNVQHLQPDTASREDAAPVRRGSARRWVLGFAGAAAAAMLGTVAVWLLDARAHDVYATSRGEQRAFKLDDGSVVYLNTQSRVEVLYSKTARDIRLLDGEALFNVEHDAARPFRVRADTAVIQAIGTRFNVYRGAGGTTVSVVEGAVRILPDDEHGAQAPRVAAGEQARVLADGEIVKRALPDVAEVVAWRERRLVFRGESLEEVARQFNRYNALQIRVQGEEIRNRHLTAVFDADDPRSLVLFLSRDPTIAVDEGPSEVVIHARMTTDAAERSAGP